jgi:LPXTG-motif cell wall-anchored protein
MAEKDYQKKNRNAVVSAEIGTEIGTKNPDGTVDVLLKDANGKIVDTYKVDPKTGKGTNEAGKKVDLPQTGMSGAHKALAGMAALMTLTGAALIKKSKKEDEE